MLLLLLLARSAIDSIVRQGGHRQPQHTEPLLSWLKACWG
jgi:hypothetical protein